MKNSVIFKELVDIIIETDFRQSEISALFNNMRPHLKELADRIHVAKIDIHFKKESEIYNIGGVEDVIEEIYYEDAAPQKQAITLRQGNIDHNYTVFYPHAGHVWTEAESRCIWAISNLILMGLGQANLIKQRDKTQYIDSMTGLINHLGVRHYGVRIENKYPIENYAGCFISLKNFKYINQHFGHNIADEVIRQYALKLYESSDRDRELVARLGAAGFFVLLRKEKLNTFLELASNIKMNIFQDEIAIPMTINTMIGICPAEPGDRVAQLITRSSFTLEQAKNDKINISYFNQGKMEVSVHKKEVIQTLPVAIKRGELVPFYQPKVHLDDGSLYGCEALVRWIHDGKMISPADFIPVAESNGLITTLDLYMLNAVCRDLRDWIDEGIEPVCISVNYSQQDFYSNTLIEDTLDIIRRYDIDGKYLEFEITESSFMESFDALDEFIKVMHNNGIRVSLDDFGTGYSSLKMFRNLELDAVKLDKSLFSSISENDHKSRVILRSIADMINQINTITVAEGIETKEQLGLVHEIGGHVVQGFIFDRPLERDEFTKRLLTGRYDNDSVYEKSIVV